MCQICKSLQKNQNILRFLSILEDYHFLVKTTLDRKLFFLKVFSHQYLPLLLIANADARPTFCFVATLGDRAGQGRSKRKGPRG